MITFGNYQQEKPDTETNAARKKDREAMLVPWLGKRWNSPGLNRMHSSSNSSALLNSSCYKEQKARAPLLF